MSKLGLIKLHFPWIVFKETTTQNSIEIKSILDKVIREISTLNKKGLRDVEQTQLSKIAKQIESIDVEKSTTAHWEEFVDEAKAIVHDIENNHGELVMTSYFTGKEPFSEPKNRKDIPDAFIYNALISISNKYGQTYFICDDNNLRESCVKIDKVTGLKTFDDLYSIPDFIAINDKYKKIEHYADGLLIIEERLDEIKEKAEYDIYNEILNDYVITSSNIPDDNNEGRLVGIDDIKSIDIDKDKVQFIDEVFYIPVQVEGVFTLEYFLFKSDYYVLPDDRSISITDHDWNDHYLLVEETFDVRFSFKYKVEKGNLDSLEFEVDDIDFEYVTPIREA